MKRSNYDLYNINNPVKVLLDEYTDMDSYDELDPIVIHTPIEEGNDMVAIFDPNKMELVRQKLPDFELYEGELHYKLPMSQIKVINPYMLLGVCKAVKLVWKDFNPGSKLIDEINAKTSMRIIPQTEISLAQIIPPIIVPKSGDYLLLTDRTKMFEELEKLEAVMFNSEYEEERGSINIHFII